MVFRVNYINKNGKKTTTTVNEQLAVFYYFVCCSNFCSYFSGSDRFECLRDCGWCVEQNKDNIKKALQSFVNEHQKVLQDSGIVGTSKQDIEIEILRRLFLSE